jgi:EAL domain-containing protein (putative c-di-GMP-specific phosphodiesterase class I)
LTLHFGLRRALDCGQFVLYFQPQIEIASGSLIGAEALIRWIHPEHGLILPGRFIPVAEENGLIVPLGEWVLRNACCAARRWQEEAGMPGLVVAVNLSALQFKRGDIERSVTRALQESGLDPSQLELELTESILIQDTEKVLATVMRLKHMGVRLSIDDFGTGYSSLSYLKRFKVDKLKIDQSFIRDLATDSESAAIVRAIIQMARSLGLRTIAEGVEDRQALELLRLYRCDEAQGYFFSPPVPAADFIATYRTPVLL